MSTENDCALAGGKSGQGAGQSGNEINGQAQFSTHPQVSPAVRTIPALAICFAAVALFAWCEGWTALGVLS
jgi:hypothetical protein